MFGRIKLRDLMLRIICSWILFNSYYFMMSCCGTSMEWLIVLVLVIVQNEYIIGYPRILDKNVDAYFFYLVTLTRVVVTTNNNTLKRSIYMSHNNSSQLFEIAFNKIHEHNITCVTLYLFILFFQTYILLSFYFRFPNSSHWSKWNIVYIKRVKIYYLSRKISLLRPCAAQIHVDWTKMQIYIYCIG